MMTLKAFAVWACMAFSVMAREEMVDGINWTYTTSGGAATVGDCYYSEDLSKFFGTRAVPQSTTGAISIPAKLGGCPVTGIAPAAFFQCSGLRSVGIPASVTNIAWYAFCGCSDLTSVTIPYGVREIGILTFSGCSGLKSVGIPESVKSIGQMAFYNCSGLASVTIPASVTNIGYGSFSCCSGLKTMYVPASWKGTAMLANADVPKSCSVVYVTLALGADNRNFAANAENGKLLKVAANVAWTAKSNVAWLTVKTGSGTGNGSIAYNVAANPGTGMRTGKITVNGGGFTRTFTVTQSGKVVTLALGTNSRTFTANAESGKLLKVTANVSWTVKSSVAWLTVKTGSGTGNGSIAYNVAANPGTGMRTGKITVNGGGFTRTFTVTQSGKVVTLVLGANSRTFMDKAENGKLLPVTANVTWTAKSSASWVVVKTASGNGNGKINYNVSANTGSASRSATIIVSGGGLARTFKVTQSGKGASSKKLKRKVVGHVAVTTSDRTEGAAVADGEEETGWSPAGAAGAWVALTFAEERTVDAVKVVGDRLPDGMRVLVSADGDTWSEEGGNAVSYLWVLLPGEGKVPVVREIVTEP